MNDLNDKKYSIIFIVWMVLATFVSFYIDIFSEGDISSNRVIDKILSNVLTGFIVGLSLLIFGVIFYFLYRGVNKISSHYTGKRG